MMPSQSDTTILQLLPIWPQSALAMSMSKPTTSPEEFISENGG